MKKTTLLLLALLMPIALVAKGDNKDAGKEFRHAAEKYEKAADRAREAAKEAPELLNEMAEHLEAMAEIKEDAAKKAEKGKWDDISWDDYHKHEKEYHELKHELMMLIEPKEKHDKHGKKE